MPQRKRSDLGRLSAEARRHRLTRRAETPSQREERLQRARTRARLIRENETDGEREIRLALNRMRNRRARNILGQALSRCIDGSSDPKSHQCGRKKRASKHFSKPIREINNAKKLIEAVRNRPFLYDLWLVQLKAGPHVNTRQTNWMEVAKIVHGQDDETTVNTVKMAWSRLRMTFVRRQRKRQTTGEIMRPWTYDNELEFLIPHIRIQEKNPYANISSITLEIPNTYTLTPEIQVKTEDPLSFKTSTSGDSQTGIIKQENLGEEFFQNKNGKERTNMKTHPLDDFSQVLPQTVKTEVEEEYELGMDVKTEPIEHNTETTYCN